MPTPPKSNNGARSSKTAKGTSSRVEAKPQASTSNSSTPSFLKVLLRPAVNAIEKPKDKELANSYVDELSQVYNEAMTIIGETTAGEGNKIPFLNVTSNIDRFYEWTQELLPHPKLTMVDFFDEEWIVNYWLPMAERICTTNMTGNRLDGSLAALRALYRKCSLQNISSERKVEILNLLGKLLEAELTVARRNDVVHLVCCTLFDYRPEMLQTRSSRKATAKLILKSTIIGPLFKFLVAQPGEQPEDGLLEKMSTERYLSYWWLSKYDVCFL